MIGLLTVVVNIVSPRQVIGGDFHHRTDDHALPIWMFVGQRGQQRQIETFVNHAIKPQARVRQVALQRMIIAPV
ncbi:hypothetical protein [Candidatus Sodalis endolongispinus]|uniref:hypothetical protein n=1 Tax=Candidatus Sodalis endolongispinus TaxID=2812662 RepID=UPI0028A91AAC|nr:hypothetical protein [Candidatus Sodalis endolongispinus]